MQTARLQRDRPGEAGEEAVLGEHEAALARGSLDGGRGVDHGSVRVFRPHGAVLYSPETETICPNTALSLNQPLCGPPSQSRQQQVDHRYPHRNRPKQN